jgi:fructose/tagatose bisphosphate aldolase
MLITLRWRLGHANCAQVETLKCQLRSARDMNMPITLKWRHENANYAQVETCEC